MTFQDGWLKRQLVRASQEVNDWSEERKSLIPKQDENTSPLQEIKETELQVS